MEEVKCHSDDEWKEIFRREEGAVKLAKRLGSEKEKENCCTRDSPVPPFPAKYNLT